MKLIKIRGSVFQTMVMLDKMASELGRSRISSDKPIWSLSQVLPDDVEVTVHDVP